MTQTSLSNPIYETIPNANTVEKVKKALKERNIEAHIVANSKQALDKIKELIPAKSSVMNGSSTTLHQIGFVDYLCARSPSVL